MVNETLQEPGPDRALTIAYAPPGARAGMAALLALDAKLGSILRTTREPMVGQMRLTWWFEALEQLDSAPPPAEPVLRALATEVLPGGVKGASLAAMIDGWEAMLGESPDDAALALFARERGGRLFDAMAALCGARDPQTRAAGEGWALADLAGNLSDAALSARARAMALERLEEATARRWSRAGRGLGALALLARSELRGERGMGRVARLLVHRLTGR